MEEQPKDRAQDRLYYQHGEDRNSVQDRIHLKNDQSHFQCQHQETQTKKTGNKKINVSHEGGDKKPHLPDSVGETNPSSNNADKNLTQTYEKQKGTQKLHTPVPKTSSKGSDHKKKMDLKNIKGLDFIHQIAQDLDNKDIVVVQNGLENCGLITNGYSSKDNDGSGSEAGYTTPKKRKPKCNNSKNTDVIKEKEKVKQPDITTQDLGTVVKGKSSRADGHRFNKGDQAASKRVAEAPPVEYQRKNSFGKTGGTFGKKSEERHRGKLSSTSKEDSWTLFKPPPVFPVDNSSAKIVPKISYASKVKENLNKVAQGRGEATAPSAKLSQDPSSPLKTITSTSFTNGLDSGSGGDGLSVDTVVSDPAASTIQSAPSVPSGENVASSQESNSSSATSPVDGDSDELGKSTPSLHPLNMQPVLPSSCPPDPPAAQTNQEALGDIFQNQWGLSFINEPNVGPKGGNEQVPAEDQISVTSQSDSQTVAAEAAQPYFDMSPSFFEAETLPQDPEQRTCAPCQVSNALSTACAIGKEETKPQSCSQEKGKTAAKGGRSSKPAPGAKPPLGQKTFRFTPPKEKAHGKEFNRRSSWGSLDYRAAVTYHTKEMESILKLHKQDPKRVVFYNESMDAPRQ